MKKPISADTLAILVSSIKGNFAAFDAGKDSSVYYASRVMEVMSQLMKDGHVIVISIWPQGDVTQIWSISIDAVDLVNGGVLLEDTAVPQLLKGGRKA